MSAKLDTDEILWNMAIAQESHVVTELGTSLIGIGALFFAYASLSASPVQPIIALIGLGGSAILWLHCFAANRDRDGALTALSKSSGFSSTRSAVRAIGGWRDSGFGRLYVPLTAATTWFMGWVALAWLWILITREVSITIPPWAYIVIVFSAFIVTYVGLQTTARARRRARTSDSQSR